MDISELLIRPEETIKKALSLIAANGRKFLMVEDRGLLLGVITDGDIRRAILKSEDFTIAVSDVMNHQPIVMHSYDVSKAETLMKRYLINAIPIVNKDNAIQSVITWQDLNKPSEVIMDTDVVIMAGGKGTRLYPYTKILPKPLIPIGDTTIIERILMEFEKNYFNRFYMTVNYKKSMIKSYYYDELSKFNVEFVEEEDYYGTAGSLALLKGKLSNPFFVSNCDILIKADYRDIMKYHKKNKNMLTVVASMKNIMIPYGVISVGEQAQVTKIIEKPDYDYLINTGMYVLNSDILDYIPSDSVFHMTDLIDYLIEQDMRVGTYPISEDAWLDMGQIKEMEEMIRKVEL